VSSSIHLVGAQLQSAPNDNAYRGAHIGVGLFVADGFLVAILAGLAYTGEERSLVPSPWMLLKHMKFRNITLVYVVAPKE
jgi:hypothetical protein